jgi:hypothetical protein
VEGRPALKRVQAVAAYGTALVAVAAGGTAAAGPAAAVQPVSSLSLAWEPAAPVQGTLFIVRVEDPTLAVVYATGTAAGEPLHFEPDAVGRLVALAAAPLDRGTVVELQVPVVRRDGRLETLRADVPVAEGRYRIERLTVAPRFGVPADSATQARIDRERERALAVSRRAHATPRLWDVIALPRETRVTSGFGSGREFNGRIQSRHTGTDFASGVGSPVRAAAGGVVALVDDFFLAGNVIYLDHGAGLVTAYFHLSETLVAEGDTVRAGDLIGRVGATGRVTGPHLHWVVRYGAISVDPLSLVERAAGLRPPVSARPPPRARTAGRRSPSRSRRARRCRCRRGRG